jgi:hypothetical protein
MDVLVSLGTNTAYIYSVLNVVFKWVKASQGSEFDGPDYFETSALLISFISLGKFLEVHAKGKTSQVRRVQSVLYAEVLLQSCLLQESLEPSSQLIALFYFTLRECWLIYLSLSTL